MATAQRFIISVLLVLTVVFAFLAQASEAAKGPKITHKVRTLGLIDATMEEKNLKVGKLIPYMKHN